MLTNAAGNAAADDVIPASAIPSGFHGLTIGIIWQIMLGDSLAYTTSCVTVSLD
jgi:hypothetical protein